VTKEESDKLYRAGAHLGVMKPVFSKDPERYRENYDRIFGERNEPGSDFTDSLRPLGRCSQRDREPRCAQRFGTTQLGREA
jgi:hypothetical protein